MTFNRIGVVDAAGIFSSGVIDDGVIEGPSKVLVGRMAIRRDDRGPDERSGINVSGVHVLGLLKLIRHVRSKRQ
jgi:hypothetical protein